jgi:hypothetical protein
VQMANEAGAHFIMPVHHQTLHEPVSVRNRTSLRTAHREIGK